MPMDLEAVERGFGECEATFGEHTITLRYRVDLDSRAFHAMSKAMRGVSIMIPGAASIKIPDTDLLHAELVRLLLPSGPDVPEHERGWDLTRGGVSIPVTIEELERLDLGLPSLFLATIMGDAKNPNRRRLSLPGSPAGADSPPTESQTTTDSSRTPPTPASTPSSLPTPISSTVRPVDSSQPRSTLPDDGSAGEIGYAV